MHIYLFHGKGGSPQGSVSVLENTLSPLFSTAQFVRPRLLHSDPNVLAEASLQQLSELRIPHGATIVGISLGGLVAAALQESARPDLSVLCISSPTWADGVQLRKKMPCRVAFYSSADEVIQGRTAEWPSLAEAYDVKSLSHDTDRHAPLLARLIAAYINKESLDALLP